VNPEKPRVLLVDDEVEFTRHLSFVLSRRGFEVEAVGDGLLALSLLSQKPYDVVVLDIKMPGMSGIQVLSEVKRFAPSVQVVLLTGHFSMTDEENTLKMGAFAYLLKPCPVMKLVDVISAAANSKTATAEEDRSLCPR